MPRTSRSRILWVGVAVVAVAAVVTVVAVVHSGGEPADLARELKDRGRLVRVGGAELERLVSGSTVLLPAASVPAVETALQGTEDEALGTALDAEGLGGLLIDGRPGAVRYPDGSVGARLAHYEHVAPLRGVYLTPAASLYLRADVPAIVPPLDEALTRVARGIISGRRPPRPSSFPEPLRERRSVEVMVMLREHGRARLWRSARGSSIARALVTAAVVARQRWDERESAMGGPIDDALPRMDVEVALLEEDGTLGSVSEAFAAKVVTADHGVGFERKGTWRYLLPSATQRAGGGLPAFLELLRDQGFTAEALERPDMRLYRLVVTPLAVSEAPLGSSSPSPFPLPDAGTVEPE